MSPPSGRSSRNKAARGGRSQGRDGERKTGQRTDSAEVTSPGPGTGTRVDRLRTVDETSAGGLVVDTETGLAAVIGRLDRRGRLLWSLPKGHIENGETVEQAAVREVAEETGIESAVVAALGSIDYWFVAEDRRVHKTVHHFLLRALGGELSDADVEVTEVAWVPLADLPQRLAYADERRIVRRAAAMLADSA
jgi:8-oxo-dGTP pyrophosphatase MutT (NUDIX family)